MDKQAIEQALKEDLGVAQALAARKPLRALPATRVPYDGVAAPGLCAQVGEVVRDGTVFYTTR